MSPRNPGFTTTEVRYAILMLERQGFRPTVMSVRDHLGGGSTRLISQILRDEAELAEKATYLAKSISCEDLFNLVVREVQFSMNEGGRESAAASLAGCLGEPKECSFREYVRRGLDTALTVPDRVIEVIQEIQDNLPSSEGDLRQNDLDHILWLRAFALATERSDIGQLAIHLGEDWLDAHDIYKPD